jgi:hypothetical protein
MPKLLVDKYKPNSLSTVLGQETALFELKRWAESWKEGRPAYKSTFLYGPPGTGKTSAVNALASDFSWNVVELNASERPKDDEIVEQLSIASQFSSIKGLNLIIIEEIDGLVTGRPLKKTLQSLEKIIDGTHNPIAITCNDEYALRRVTPYFKQSSLTLRFSPLKEFRIKAFLEEVMRREKIEQPNLDKLIEYSNRDLRYCLNNLQLVELSPRHEDQAIFGILHDIFRGEWDGDNYGIQPELIWYGIQSNIDNFYDDIYGMPVAEYKAVVDMMFARKRIIGSKQGVSESFRMMKHINALFKCLPMHQKTAKIEIHPNPFKQVTDENIQDYARAHHMSYKKACGELHSFPELLELYIKERESVKAEEPAETTTSIFSDAEPDGVGENVVKAVAKQQSLF